MKSNKIHIVLGTVICAATMLLFLAFNSKLPESIPIQITIDGSVGNTLPKPLFVFGLPVAFVAVNLIRSLSLAKKEDTSTYSFYIVPGIALLISAATLWLALSIQ